MPHTSFRLRSLSVLLAVGLVALSACDGTAADGPTPEPGAGPECVPEIVRICNGDVVGEENNCTDEFDILEACPRSCHLGACVDCSPNAGAVCDGNALRSVDSCGAIGDVVETCDNGCRAGGCVSAECTPDATRVCITGDVHSEDSCGNAEGFVQSCPNGCTGGVCDGCDANASLGCVDGDIYNFDSCGSVGEVQTDCGADVCQLDNGNIACVPGVVCTPDAAVACFSEDLYRVDSCGSVQSDALVEACPNGCTNGVGCNACVQVADSTICAGDNLHDLRTGCGLAPTQDLLIETCEFGCGSGACLEEGTCVPNNGLTCEGGNVVTVDSCGDFGPISETCTDGCTGAECIVPVADLTCTAGDGDYFLSGGDIDGTVGCGGCLGNSNFSCDEDNRSVCIEECAALALTCSENVVLLEFEITVAVCPSEDPIQTEFCDAVCLGVGAP